MASSVKEFIRATSTGSPTSKAFTVTAVVGDVIIVFVSNNNDLGATGVTDSAGNTYTQIEYKKSTGGGGSTSACCLVCTVTTGGTLTLTASRNGSGLAAFLCDGLTGAVHTNSSASALGTPLVAPITTTVACSVFVLASNAISANMLVDVELGYTEDFQSNLDIGWQEELGHQLAVAAGSYSPGVNYNGTLTTFRDYTILFVVALEESGGSGTTRGAPFGSRGTAFNGGRTFMGILR